MESKECILVDGSVEDTHFYVDNVPPDELKAITRVLHADPGLAMTCGEIADALRDNVGFVMQRDHTYSPRRLFDLGLAGRQGKGAQVRYHLSESGVRLRDTLSWDAAFASELLHYLHFVGFKGRPGDRRTLWSYRRCCDLIWKQGKVGKSAHLASVIQAEIRSLMGESPVTRVGARFASDAVGKVCVWLAALSPSPFAEDGSTVQPRIVDRPELLLLALEDVYQTHGYHHGDQALLDEELLDHAAAVFFLDPHCCRDLLPTASAVYPSYLGLGNTLAGPTIALRRPFTLESL